MCPCCFALRSSDQESVPRSDEAETGNHVFLQDFEPASPQWSCPSDNLYTDAPDSLSLVAISGV